MFLVGCDKGNSPIYVSVSIAAIRDASIGRYLSHRTLYNTSTVELYPTQTGKIRSWYNNANPARVTHMVLVPGTRSFFH